MYNLERKGRTLNFSDLGDSVADKLYSGRMRIKKALEECPSELTLNSAAGKMPVRKCSAQISMRCSHG